MTAIHPFVAARRKARPLAVLPSLALLALLCAPADSRALPGLPEARYGVAALRMAELLETKHLDAAPLDDARSRLFFDRYLETLDPSRLYFLDSDIQDFASARDSLDDRLRAGDFGFALAVFTRFAQRVDERLADVRGLLETPIDFDVEEYFAADRRQAPHARTMVELRDLWRRQTKLELLGRMEAGASLDAARRAVVSSHEEIARNVRATTAADLAETYLTALATTYDPHTAYLTPKSLKEFDVSMRLELEGIGAMLGSVEGHIMVQQLVAGGAAERDGRLKPGDRIVAVSEGENGELADVSAMRLVDVIGRIRGKRGTTVRLDVLHGTGAAETILLQRAKVEVQDRAVKGEVILREGAGRTPLRVGVVTLPSFYRDFAAFGKGSEEGRSSSRDLGGILESFRRDSVDVVVVDVRHNPGGALVEAVQVTGLFIDSGPVIQIKGPGDELRTESDADAGVSWDGPLVVLTSRSTASAAEIFAGAIQDHGRGIVVGDRSTHGKGTVQSMLPLGAEGSDDGPEALGSLKLTVSQFYRPLGQTMHGLGVVPDLELPSLTSYEGGEAQLGSRVRIDSIPALRFERREMASPDLVAELRQRSGARLASSKEFRRVREEIARHLDSRSRRWIPLARERFSAELGPAVVAPATAGIPVFRADPRLQPAGHTARTEVDAYLSEVLDIASDYALASRKP